MGIYAIILGMTALWAVSARGAGKADLKVRVDSRAKVLSIYARVRGPYRVAEAWEMVRDYDHLAEYMPGVDSSYVVGRTDSSVLVRQVGSVRIIIKKHFYLNMQFTEEEERRRLHFKRVGGSLRRFEGVWEIDPAGEGVEIVYRALLEHKLKIPGFLMRFLVRRRVKKMMQVLMEELHRREEARGGVP